MSQISSSYGATLTAFFDERDDAEEAVQRLVEQGIPSSNVRLVPGHERDGQQADTGVRKGFFESLADFFMPHEDRYAYAEGLSRGGYLVTVSNLSAGQHEIALDILDDEGAIDFDEREQSWRSEGWGGYTADSDLGGAGSSSIATGGLESSVSTGSGYSSSGFGQTESRGYGATEEGVIPVVQEELRIGKRDVNLGRVRVRSYVVEEPVSEQVHLHDERVVVERRPVDRSLTGSEAAFQDRTIEAEEHAEEAVVAKTARVTEEIALRKEAEDRTETVSDTVRYTEVEVEDDRGLADRSRTGRI